MAFNEPGLIPGTVTDDNADPGNVGEDLLVLLLPPIAGRVSTVTISIGSPCHLVGERPVLDCRAKPGRVRDERRASDRDHRGCHILVNPVDGQLVRFRDRHIDRQRLRRDRRQHQRHAIGHANGNPRGTADDRAEPAGNGIAVDRRRLVANGTTQIVYLDVQAVFGISSLYGLGKLEARRAR